MLRLWNIKHVFHSIESRSADLVLLLFIDLLFTGQFQIAIDFSCAYILNVGNGVYQYFVLLYLLVQG